MAAPWEKYGNPAAQYGPDPVKVRQEERAQNREERAQNATDLANNNSAQSNAIATQNAALQQQKFQAELLKDGLVVGPNGEPIINPNAAASRPGKPMRQGDADKLAEQVDSYAALKDALGGFEDDFAGNTVTGRLENWAQGALDVGTPGQRQWWANFYAADNLIRNSLFGASLTDGEKQAYAQTTVDPSMSPATVKKNIEERLEIARKALGRRTGRLRATFNNEEIDAAVGEFVEDFSPNSKQPQERENSPDDRVNKTLLPPTGGPKPPSEAKKTLGTERLYSTDDDLRQNAELETAYDNGATLQELVAIKQRHVSEGVALPFDAPTISNIAKWISARDTGNFGKEYNNLKYSKNMNHFNPAQSGRRSDTQIMVNKALLSPLGTAATTATSALGLGTLEALAPEALAQQRETNPMSALAGDVGGMIGGTAAIAKVGQSAAAKYAPSLLGGGRKAAFVRSVAPDAAYGAAYGGMTQGDPLSGAKLAIVGNLAGRGIAKGIGGIAKGVDDPAVQYLTQRDIPLSVGQTLGNRGVAGRIMSKLESLPVVGDLLARQRVQGLQAFEREALNDVVQPIGGRVTQGGAEGLEQAQGAVSDAYGNALRGVNIPGDEQFVQETGEALARGSAIPDLGSKFRYAVDNRVGPMFEGGSLSGAELQQALQNLGSIRSSFAKEGPMGQFVADATGQIDDALTGLVGRQAPDVMPQYNAAKGAFSRLAPFENARISGINQEAVTPAQIARAVTSNTKNFGGRAAAARGENLSDLMKYGQEVLPSTVPNSGTADRLGGMGSILLPTALGGSAYGLSTLSDNPEISIPLGVLAAASTKTGQKAFQTLATKRTDRMRRASSLIGGRKAKKGLSGLVTAPLLVEDY